MFANLYLFVPATFLLGKLAPWRNYKFKVNKSKFQIRGRNRVSVSGSGAVLVERRRGLRPLPPADRPAHVVLGQVLLHLVQVVVVDGVGEEALPTHLGGERHF